MNTWVYMILIAALFVVVAFMLYARFSTRSRGKLLHHSPGDISLESFDRDRPEAVGPTFDDLSEDSFLEEDTLLMEDRKSNSSVSLSAAEAVGPGTIQVEPTAGDLQEGEAKPNEREEEEAYLDDLQEAAAGLAMLMRSSPLQDRATPVVFAPEDESEVDEISSEGIDAPRSDEYSTILIPAIEAGDEAQREDDAESEVAPTPEETGDFEKHAAVADEEISYLDAGLEEAEPVSESSLENIADAELESSRPSLIELLGDEVAGKFSLIDEDLDALENLVAGVESRLSDWNRDEESTDVVPNSEVLTVEEAA